MENSQEIIRIMGDKVNFLSILKLDFIKKSGIIKNICIYSLLGEIIYY